jgi:putative intracellular protease/amidase
MKRRLLLFAATVLLSIPLVVGGAGEKPVVLLIARGETAAQAVGVAGLELEMQKEVIPMVSKLNEAGFSVEIASASGATIKAGQSELKVDKKLADVNIQDYVGIIIPCMGEIPRAIPQKAVEIIKTANSRNMPLAAQMSGVELLGAASVLDGKNFAVGDSWRGFIKGGDFKGTGVVQDGNIVTSGVCPWMAATYGMKDGTDELMTTFIRLLKK